MCLQVKSNYLYVLCDINVGKSFPLYFLHYRLNLLNIRKNKWKIIILYAKLLHTDCRDLNVAFILWCILVCSFLHCIFTVCCNSLSLMAFIFCFFYSVLFTVFVEVFKHLCRYMSP